MTPRVKVSPMPGTMTQWPWDAGHGYWRWRCEACTNLGHWTTADYAHDNGREHARQCTALKGLKYTQLVEQANAAAAPEWGETRTSISAAGPDVFDCSGLMSWALDQGVDLT